MTVDAAALPRRGIRRPDVSRRSIRVWQRNRDVYLRLWKSELIWPLIEPLVTLFALGVGLGGLVELASGERYIEFIAPGLLAVWPMWAAASECGWGSFFRMENQRTFDAIVATPVSVEDVITGEILWGATRGFISAIYILVVIVAWGLVDSPLTVFVPFAAILPGLMFASISLSYTSVAWSISSLNYFFALFISPMFWLGGVFFPLEELPEWAQTVAWFLPASHVVDVYRGLTSGDLAWAHLVDIAWMLVVTGAFYMAALYSMRRRLVK
jgi:lipooligosaccharide transport system permease protein